MRDIKHWGNGKVSILITFFCILFSAVAIQSGEAAVKSTKGKTSRSKVEMKNTFTKPDFAYPATVSEHAGAEYRSALASGNGEKALKAAIQMSIADTSVSSDSVTGSLARFDYISNKFGAPWNTLARLLEAETYVDVYRDQAWKYNTRKLPVGVYPADVKEWSRDLFAAKVDSLVALCNEDSKALGAMGLSEIAGLLQDYRQGVDAGMTVADFIDMTGSSLLREFEDGNGVPLRFGNSAGAKSIAERCAENADAMVENAIQRNTAAGNNMLAAQFSRIKYYNISYAPKRKAWLDECYGRYGDTPWGAVFVNDYAAALYSGNSFAYPLANTDVEKTAVNAGRAKALTILEDYLKKYPAAEGIDAVKRQIADLRSTSATLTMNNQVLPGRSWKCGMDVQGAFNGKVLVYRLKDDSSLTNVKLSDVLKSGKLAATVPYGFSGAVPDIVNDSVTMPALAPGRYAAFPSKDGTVAGIIGNGVKSNIYARPFMVSGLSYFFADSNDEAEHRLYVVDGVNQKPIAGAKVHRTERSYRGEAKSDDYVTDRDGCAILPNSNSNFVIRSGNDYLTGNYYSNYLGGNKSHAELSARILTDLAIYKPGDEARFVGVVWEKRDNSLKEKAAEKIRVTLIDANYNAVDTLQVLTDRYGRVSGSFTIPKSGLLGTYQIRAEKDERILNSSMITVAEYKSPTFVVTTGDVSGEYIPGDTLRIKGTARTYSGMPVAGAKVDYTVRYTPWRTWFGAYQGTAECGGATTTDGDGNFIIELPTSTVKDTPYEKGLFSLNVSATDAAGETQTAPAIMFSLAKAYSLSADVPDMICVGDKDSNGKISVKVSDMTGHPVEKTVYYTVSRDGNEIEKGKFESPVFAWDVEKMQSGRYTLRFSLQEDMKSDGGDDITATTVVWRRNESVPPVNTALWVPQQRFVVAHDKASVMIPVGTSYSDSWLFMVVSDSKNIRERRWLDLSKDIKEVEVPAPGENDRLFVTFTGLHDLDNMSATVELIPESQLSKVEIATESFRDRLEPGTGKKWSFRFTIDGKPMSSRPVMAVMTNKALNALVPFRWNLNPYSTLYWNNHVRVSASPYYKFDDSFRSTARVSGKNGRSFTFPQWNLYGRTLYSAGGVRIVDEMFYSVAPTSMRIRGSRSDSSIKMKSAQMAAGAVMNDAVVESTDEEVAPDGGSQQDGGVQQENEEMRPVELPIAFFMPDMVTDSNGVVAVDFVTPQFNGTWQFQIAGYTGDMRGDVSVMDAVASKKVMVQMNAPRFLRTGDRAVISATLYNNSDGGLDMGGRLEIVDPADGRILESRDYDKAYVKAAGQRTVSIEYTVPGNVSQVLLRAYAEGGGHRDGEQTLVAVLPSSTPVTEARPFYAGPGERTIAAQLPPNASDATVTLQYCGNPVWECVTALPEILTPSSTNILSQVSALYGTAVANGLVRKYPQIGEAIKSFAENNDSDSTLVSNLQKNAALKTVALNNTPWVRNAADETRRMGMLTEYLDAAKAENSIREIVSLLRDRQNNDGGWGWCPDMQSSEFITSRVLLHLAMLNGMGYMPQNAADMVPRAFKYTDNELTKAWKKSPERYFSVTGMLNYLYVKSFFADVKDSGDFASLRSAAMKKIASEWKDFGIYDKATAVTLEWRCGNKQLAREILESLRQFASVSAEKGMWFDNLRGEYSNWNPLITTAQVLEAYGEADPASDSVDKLRQWLLMSKQTQSWSENRGTAEVVNALLTTGSDWTVPSREAVVTIGGKAVDIPRRARITDSFTLTLTPRQTAAGDIRIEKYSAGPAWGGIVSQYVAPILDVKADAIPQLSIEKRIYSVSTGESGATVGSGNLKVGDKVRVTLTITCDRALDYVAVTDSRSACLEPAEQISGYTSSDGTWFYREVRNDATNLFIPYLSKGSHVISYECYVDRSGDYTLGIATAQSQYAPTITAHSAGVELRVSE